MNFKQNYAITLMDEGHNIFLTGGGGVGKSYVIQKFIERYRADKNKISKSLAITSTTGVSAVLIKGKTLHSWAGIGLGKGDLIEKIKNNNKALSRWLSVKILIIDEISMLNPRLFERLDKVARHFRVPTLPFGGIQLIIVGDFCQLPVVKGDGDFCFDSPSWKECEFKVVNLTQVIRQDNIEFANVLQELRFGNISKKTRKLLLERTGKWTRETCNKDGIKPTLLYSTNKNVDELNKKELEELIKLELPYKIYKVKTGIIKSPINMNMNDLINLIDYYTKDVKKIKLAVNAQVMLTKNIDVDNGLANGSRGIITGFKDGQIGLPIVKFMNGIEIEIPLYKSKYNDGEVEFVYEYIPLKLAWATTIHKSQGATLDYVVANLSNIFEYGQAYVALSRAKSLENLYLTGINFNKIMCHPDAKKYYKNLENNNIDYNKI
jgi:ATP-dependent DNA helicase PIF1